MSSAIELNCAVTGNVMSEMNKQSSVVPMAIVATLFFILGFATWLNGSLMPFLQQVLQHVAFELPYIKIEIFKSQCSLNNDCNV